MGFFILCGTIVSRESSTFTTRLGFKIFKFFSDPTPDILEPGSPLTTIIGAYFGSLKSFSTLFLFFLEKNEDSSPSSPSKSSERSLASRLSLNYDIFS